LVEFPISVRCFPVQLFGQWLGTSCTVYLTRGHHVKI
jgi:hypothetical protein